MAATNFGSQLGARWAAALQCAVLLLSFGAVDLHGLTAGHGLGGEPVVTGARHDGQARHWEAIESLVVPDCPDCLLRAPSKTAVPVILSARPPEPGLAPPPTERAAPRPASRSSASPRGPPSA